MTRRQFLDCGLLLLCLCLAAPASAAASPEQFVTGFLDRAFGVFQSSATDRERELRLRTLFADNMDVPAIAHWTADDYLAEVAPALQQRFRDLLVDYLVRAYYGKIEQAAGAPFDTRLEPPLDDGTQVVTTVIHKPGFWPVRIGWHLRPAQGSFRIVDVIRAGTSLVTTQRAVFFSVMRDGGLPHLVARLEAHTASASP